MADISMCVNHKCPSKLKCYRYTAPWNEYRQTISGYSHDESTGKCDSFWDNTGYAKDVRVTKGE